MITGPPGRLDQRVEHDALPGSARSGVLATERPGGLARGATRNSLFTWPGNRLRDADILK